MKPRIFSEVFDPVPPDEAADMQDAEDDARWAREKKITTLIKQAFQRMKFSIDWVSYDEAERLAEVDVMGAVPLQQLAAIPECGLSDDYSIDVSGVSIRIAFKVRPELDNAV